MDTVEEGPGLSIQLIDLHQTMISNADFTVLAGKNSTRYMLMPVYNHNTLQLNSRNHQDEYGYQVVAFTSKCGCFPDIGQRLERNVCEPTPAKAPIEGNNDLALWREPLLSIFSRKGKRYGDSRTDTPGETTYGGYFSQGKKRQRIEI